MVDYQIRRAGMQLDLRNKWNKGCKCNRVLLHLSSLLFVCLLPLIIENYGKHGCSSSGIHTSHLHPTKKHRLQGIFSSNSKNFKSDTHSWAKYLFGLIWPSKVRWKCDSSWIAVGQGRPTQEKEVLGWQCYRCWLYPILSYRYLLYPILSYKCVLYLILFYKYLLHPILPYRCLLYRIYPINVSSIPSYPIDIYYITRWLR